ncbi:agarase [Vibrio sp. 10N.286.49.C2]|uniref:beta-galactosidase n=1 Tax=unclassified Vibrio TaxID=2614977 RepID=UPI000C84028B|nr:MULTISPECIES: beta-galactosidase [unclassified Vibrio]PMH26421.1 agarase [Vibrio sp. 10N.286.49.C2]PMH54855.1 agarase [Vibrio sp. 10N.286.49.B1]PMH84093.1 agarase [Vibrio sp. 10N.286.48.B7]
MSVSANDAVTFSEHDTSISLFDFTEANIPSQFSFENIEAHIVSSGEGITAGKHALKIHTHSKENFYTSIVLEPSDGEVWDWSLLPAFSFAFDATNIGQRSTQLFINLFDHKGQMHSRCATIPSQTDDTYLVELKGEFLKGKTNFDSGLRSNPASFDTPFTYATWMWGLMNVDLTSIVKIELSIHGTLIDHDLVFDNFRLMLNPEPNPTFLEGVIDQYGQNRDAFYSEKVTSDEDLLARTSRELQLLKEGAMPDRGKFGGYIDGKRLEATGFFRTEKIDGKWSLVDPEGYPYFATGIDIIRLANAYTITGVDYDHNKVESRTSDDVTPEDSKEKVTVPFAAKESAHVANKARRDIFQWLPSYEEPLGDHYAYMRELFEGPVERGETFSFYAANLQRKYGLDYLEKWREVTLDRMLNWGFTSLGNWTNPEFYSNEKIPFFANGWIIGDFKTVSSGDDFWAALPDPFDPVFRERARATVTQVREEIKETPWCVGIFIDNEKSWGRMGTIEGHHGIAIHTLGRDMADCPTKLVFVDALRAKYTTIDALNARWGTSIASWDTLGAGVKGLDHNEAQLEDYGMLLEVFASEYFRVVNEELKAQLPNHLYLGVRFADWGMTPDVVRAAAKHCDVISYNYYKEGLHPEPWKFLPEIDMPSIIGEYHIGSKDVGFYHPGLVCAANQQERSEMYESYMHTVIDNPYFVGAHWFQYIDSPIAGRSFDGENYNVGFVSTADVPYEPMVEAAQRLHSQMYKRRYQK